jgi:hypothetical protein
LNFDKQRHLFALSTGLSRVFFWLKYRSTISCLSCLLATESRKSIVYVCRIGEIVGSWCPPLCGVVSVINLPPYAAVLFSRYLEGSVPITASMNPLKSLTRES